MLARLDRLLETMKKAVNPANSSISAEAKRALAIELYHHGFIEGNVCWLGPSTIGDYEDSKKALDNLQFDFDNHRNDVLTLMGDISA